MAVVADGALVVVSQPAWSVEAAQAAQGVEVASGLVRGVPFAGPYEVVPTDVAQVIPVTGLTMSRDLTVAPIPSNYGRIEWNGSALTVS